MKAKKKPKGTKARVQASKERLSYIGVAITVTILIAITAFSCFLIYSSLSPSSNHTINPNQTNNPIFQLKAVIVDHLSLSAPNQTFIQTATNTLTTAGYTVDYYPGEEVTVEFYRNLPMYGYDIIILRVHSAVSEGTSRLALFTSEPYSKTKYVYQQLVNQVTLVGFQREGPYYFGINSFFVTQAMKGQFQNTVIIMMGCDGLRYSSTAEAFIEKGAKVFVSWSDSVLASHTDQATTQLLKRLLTEKQKIKQAVTETLKEVGRDPAYNSLLDYYPFEVGDQTVEDITGTPATKP